MLPWIRMHAFCYDRSADHSAQWQDLELTFSRLLQRGYRHVKEEGKELRMLHLDPQKHSCMRVWDLRKLHVFVYENAQTIISWLLPAFKGFYDRHAQLTSYCINTQNVMCATHTVYMQTLIGVFFVHGNGNTFECLTRGWNLFYFDGLHI